MTKKICQEANRVWGAANAAFFFKQEQDGCGGSAGVEVIAAALEKTRNEAIDEMRDAAKKIATAYCEIADIEADIDAEATRLKEN